MTEETRADEWHGFKVEYDESVPLGVVRLCEPTLPPIPKQSEEGDVARVREDLQAIVEHGRLDEREYGFGPASRYVALAEDALEALREPAPSHSRKRIEELTRALEAAQTRLARISLRVPVAEEAHEIARVGARCARATLGGEE